MVWCSYCGKDQPTETDDLNGFICCTGCGRVLDDNIYSSDPTFIKGAGGQSQFAGNFVKDSQYSSYGRLGGDSVHEYGFKSDSHEKTLEKGREEIEIIAESLSVSGREDSVNAGHRLYIIAVERNFTRGRRTKQVAAACLYIVCRQEQKPFLLIDFSDVLQINVYVLGAVFLQLCKLLRLEQHPIIQKPVDPSLFIHRFADRLVGRTTTKKQFHAIANTALRILASMKRDWMQTGRKPSGVCGAALYISALSHGFVCTKTDVVSIVHICEGTLTKRLIEFENTDSGCLTIEEFENKAKELEAEMQTIKVPALNTETKGIKGITDLLCEHKDMGSTHFKHGLCQSCYEEFLKVSGGIQGGAEPPAFQRAEKQRKEDALRKIQEKSFFSDEEDEEDQGQIGTQKRFEDGSTVETEKEKQLDQKAVKDGNPGSQEQEDAEGSSHHGNSKHMYRSSASKDGYADGPNGDSQTGVMGSRISEAEIDDWTQTQSQASNKVGDEMDEELETLSDIDDDEVERYLHNEEEVRLKTLIWTEMNKEYIEEQAAKEEAIAAAESAHAAALAAAAEGAPDAVELAAAAAAAVAKLKKDKQRKRAEESKNKVPAQSAAEATRQMLTKKKLSSKVNYDVLEKLFEDNKKNGTEMSNATEDTQNNLTVENGKRNRSVSWAEGDDANLQVSKRQALYNEINPGKITKSKEVTDPKMEDEPEDEDFDIPDQDGMDHEQFQPYEQYEHEDEYDYEEY